MMSLQHEEGLKLSEEGGKNYQAIDMMHKEEVRYFVCQQLYEKQRIRDFETVQVAIIGGALSYREMSVSEVMTPVKEAFMMSASESLSYKVRGIA